MARTVLPFVGAAVGWFVGGPVGAQVGFALGGVVGNAVDPVKNIGPRIGETGAQTSAEGAQRGIVYGTVSVTGNVIAASPLIKGDFEEEGGKGGPVNVTERGFRTYAIRICEGPIAENGVLRVWEDDKLVYDMRNGSTLIEQSEQWLGASVFYWGDEGQLPDVFMTINIHEDTPAYRGSAYFMGAFRDLTDRRGSIPQYRFEVATSTQEASVLAPLIINDWDQVTDGPPSHLDGETLYHSAFGEDFDNLPDAIAFQTTESAASADPYVSETGPFATNYIGFIASDNTTFNLFPGGANLGSDPEVLIYRLAARTLSGIVLNSVGGPSVAAEVVAVGGAVADAATYYTQRSETDNFSGSITNEANLWKTFVSAPGTGEFSFPVSGTGVNANLIQANIVLPLTVTRVPSPPAGYTKVTGTAKILCDNEYRDNVLYQRALGPVLLPSDPNYSDSAFWADAAADAIAAGDMHDDVTTPVVVSSYATGTTTAVGSPVPLADIVTDIHERCGVSNFDVSELDDQVAGLVLAGDYSGADSINTLRGPYFFDKAEADGTLWYPKRGAAVVDTLTIDDLIDEPDTQMREQAIEYPRKFHLFYQHANSGYATVKATSQRSSPDVRVVGEATAQVPVVLNEDQAAQTAHKMHKVSWAEAEGEVKFSVPCSFIHRVPSNPIGLAVRGRVNRLRITEMGLADGVIDVTCRHDRQSAYTSNVTGVPIPDPTPPPPTIVGSTTLVVLDIPSLRDADDDLNIYYAVTGTQPAWNGAVVQRSSDGGATWDTDTAIRRASVIGELTAPVADASADDTDTTNTVSVRLLRSGQSLESISDAQFLSEQGAFAIKDAGGFIEILQARDWVQDSDGVFHGTTLHRGRLNTQTNPHAAGATFVLMDTVHHVQMPSAMIGQAVTYRAPSLGQAPELAAEQTETYTGQSQTEWPVASLSLARDVSDVITGTWAPRHRFGTDDAPVASINFQGYRITIVGSSTVTFDQTAATLSYDASALGASVTVSVQAINRITGAGPATSGTI